VSPSVVPQTTVSPPDVPQIRTPPEPLDPSSAPATDVVVLGVQSRPPHVVPHTTF